MIARIVTIALGIAVTLAVPAILAVNGLRLATNDEYVRAVYEHGGVPDDRHGLSAAERTRLALVGLSSIKPSSAAGIEQLRTATLGSGKPAFTAPELSNIENVRTLVARAYRLQVILIVAIGILALLLSLLRTMRSLVPVALARGALLTIVLAFVVAVMAATGYGSFETPLNAVSAGDPWRFAEADTLRRVYPDRFWLDTAIVIGALAVVQALVVFLVARVWARSAGGRQASRLRARTQSP